MHQQIQGATFHVEHVVPSSRGGSTTLANLALACPSCNLHKSDLTDALDPQSGERAPLFNPRTDAWGEHFVLREHRVVGLTPRGRGTVAALQMNTERRVRIRAIEDALGLGAE